MKKLNFILEYREYLQEIEHLDNIADKKIYAEILKQKLSEGLITTADNKKTIRVLKKRFKHTTYTIGEDGEVSMVIKTPHKPLSYYLPLINNLGYFISQLQSNGKWIKDFNDDTIPSDIDLEPKYDLEMVIPKVLYHTSPLKFKKSIKKMGLIPKSGNKLVKHPDRIYLTDDIKVAKMFGSYITNEMDSGFIIYKINTDNLNIKLFSDVNLKDGGYYTLNNIKKENISVLFDSRDV